MSNHSLVRRGIPVTLRLRSVNDPPHLILLLIRQLHIPRRPILLQPLRLGCTRNCNHALGSNPRERNLGRGAALLCCELLDLLDDGFVLVEVFTLEFGYCCSTT